MRGKKLAAVACTAIISASAFAQPPDTTASSIAPQIQNGAVAGEAAPATRGPTDLRRRPDRMASGGCAWDNGIVPNGINGRALSPPNFPDIRVVDDVIGGGCTIGALHANVIEDAGWVSGDVITVFTYADTGNGPGDLMDSVDLEFTRMATGDEYFGRAGFDYWIENVAIELPPGTSWLGMRNPNGSGSGTNYWMTSDGGADGPGSDTGWFSLDGGNTFSPEGATWHHAFEFEGELPANGACCLPDGSCTDDVPPSECRDAGGRFARETLCADIDPPCVELTGRCCIRGENEECLVVTATECRDLGGEFDGFRLDCEGDPCDFVTNSCCLPDGSCTDDVPEQECRDVGGRFTIDTFCEDLDPPCVEQTGKCCIDGENPVCEVITGTECRDRGGDFAGYGTDCSDHDPCGFNEGACCIFPDCLGTMRFAECEDLGGNWFEGETCPEFQCPDILNCSWDNGIITNGVNGRALSPPNFPDIRVVDDVIVPAPGCDLVGLHANVIEDAGWVSGERITVYAYEDTGNGPGALLDSVEVPFTKMDTGDEYFGRADFEYWIAGVGIELPEGKSWIGMRNAGGSGAGTNYWMTSDGGADGPGSDTGWFSLDGGATWSPEGATWHHAFEMPANGACCLADGSCTDNVPSSECRMIGGRFAPNRLCENLDPPCEEQTGGCCIEGGGGCTRDPEWQCDGDTDGDGQVNPVDSGLVQAAFGSDDPADLCQYDLDCDGQINPVDSGIVQSLFGTCDPPRDECGGGGGDPECAVVTGSECRERGGEFLGFGTDCADDPCGFATGACCVDLECVGTTRRAACDDQGGRWHEGEDCGEFQCPDVIGCIWDNNIVPNGVNGRAISPPNFPDIRVVDDIVADAPGCTILNFHANVIEDAGWSDGNGTITVFVHEDTGNGPGALMAEVNTEYTKMATGDNYFGRDDYDYWVEAVEIELPTGTSWVGIRNPNGSGAGTNYWMTSDGGTDGSGSDTGWFSLDGGNTFQPEGDAWHHAFEVLP